MLAIAVVLAPLTGCGGPAVTGEELFDQAREVNFAYKAAVADVQLQLFEGEWTLEGYGDRSRSVWG
ncbi:hypothetical protein QFZ53_001694 [Microbacterium natoriense]|uniref:Uncharacterized protein n=1 Tax=Microbacterium natoriense TaxID=284570 RepID=A0AAW8EW80_9MICO|nr:hypothetical protein [Microbacterium natoriense]